jgi:deoxyribodipyrimidine photo-lyase
LENASVRPAQFACSRLPADHALDRTSDRLQNLVVDNEDLSSLVRLDRDRLVAGLAAAFPDAAAAAGDPAAAVGLARRLPVRGGRQAAVAALERIDPVAYARTRNHVGGAVTGLSPWIRHGVLSLAEVRDAALARVERPEAAEKLITELAWRDYWRQVHATLGTLIGTDIEPPAAAPRQVEPLTMVPADVLAAATGMRCIDAFVRRLHETGSLHNHERMWLASWLVHVRGVRWQAGADWFLSHLLDGDPASNHLSWQWVAGTFAAKPYLFNRENLESFTAGVHCRPCPLLGHCDVEGTYEALAARLFTRGMPPAPRPAPRIRSAAAWTAADPGDDHVIDRPPPGRPLVWLTLDAAAEASPAAAAWPGQPRLFVLDRGWLAAEKPALKRLVFLFECLADVPECVVAVGDPRSLVPAVANARGCDGVALAETPCPRTRAAAAAIAADMPVAVVRLPRFCDRRPGSDLGRFSRSWNAIRASALRPT